MATLDEITKEKQRISVALARVDTQRERLVGQLSELEAAERVLARYSGSTPARRKATTNARPCQHRRPLPRDDAGAGALRPQYQLSADAARPT